MENPDLPKNCCSTLSRAHMCCASVLVCAMCVCLCCVCLSGQNWLQADTCVVCVCNRGLGQYCHSTGTVLGQYWHSTGPVLAQYWPSTGSVLAQYWPSPGPVLAQYWHSTGTVLAQYPHSTELSTARVHAQPTQPTTRHQHATPTKQKPQELRKVTQHTTKHRAQNTYTDPQKGLKNWQPAAQNSWSFVEKQGDLTNLT